MDDKDATSPAAKDQRATGPGTVTNKDGAEAPDRLGPSDHVGKPRTYAENALDELDADPLPETPPGGGESDRR